MKDNLLSNSSSDSTGPPCAFLTETTALALAVGTRELLKTVANLPVADFSIFEERFHGNFDKDNKWLPKTIDETFLICL